jgi:hypothetical protein
MTAREIETINEIDIFTEALVASVALGELAVEQLKSQLEGGLAYVAAQDADDIEEELVVALVALDLAIWRITSPVCGLGSDRIPAVDAPSAVTSMAGEGKTEVADGSWRLFDGPAYT